jgi:hypothetical protein
MTVAVTKSEKEDAVRAWRQSHIEELDKTLAVFKAIRDSEESRDKDKIDAGIAIARLLGAVTADGRVKTTAGMETARPQHQKSERENIDRWLDKLG